MTSERKSLKERWGAAWMRARQSWDRNYDPEGELQIPRPKPGEDPDPPWVTYPFTRDFVYWGGWRQGAGEEWLLQVWLPFWRSRTAEQRERYLAHWPPPNSDWQSVLERQASS